VSSSPRPFPWLPIARAAWAVLALLIIVLFSWGAARVLSEPAAYCALAIQTEVACVEAEAAAQWVLLGIPGWYLPFVSVLHDVVVPLVHLVIALLIFWRARDSWLGLAASVVLVIFAAWINTDVLNKLVLSLGEGPVWNAFFVLLNLAMFASLTFMLFTFPDGRFTHRWLAAVCGLQVLLLVLANILLPAGSDLPIIMLTLGGGLSYQVYRYLRLSSPTQRQQTKWVLVGLAGFFAIVILWGAVVDPALQRGANAAVTLALFGPVNAVLSLSLPVALGISILRYRLWDIDLIIRRTLVYTGLTATLALVYLGSVLGLQALLRLLTGQDQSQLVTVVSTLAIAALFVPVRAAVQRVIDRRFYRRKYDAAQTLSDFSAAARDEVELNRLTDGLVNVVDKTMQPAQITLWLRQTTPQSE
jgi:hypothetical protein